MPAIDQMIAILRSITPAVTVVAIVSVFFTLAYMLWAFRKTALRD